MAILLDLDLGCLTSHEKSVQHLNARNCPADADIGVSRGGLMVHRTHILGVGRLERILEERLA